MNNKACILVVVIASLLALLVAPVHSQCGNAGEDYYELMNIFLGYDWIYPFDIFSKFGHSTCSPIDTPSCNSHGCSCGWGATNLKCAITNLTAVNAGVANLNLNNFSTYLPNDPYCGCHLPPTPAGKYLYGYELTIPGKQKDWSTITWTGPCHISPLYQDSPLKYNDTFSQIIDIIKGK